MSISLSVEFVVSMWSSRSWVGQLAVWYDARYCQYFSMVSGTILGWSSLARARTTAPRGTSSVCSITEDVLFIATLLFRGQNSGPYGGESEGRDRKGNMMGRAAYNKRPVSWHKMGRFFIFIFFIFVFYKNIFSILQFTVLYPYRPPGGGRGPAAR